MDITELEKYPEILDITFDDPDFNPHLALCHRSQGYAANGHSRALIMKAEDVVTEEAKQAIKKFGAPTQVTVDLSMQEFLRKFFDMWYDDAELLAKLLGFETEAEYKVRTEGEFSYVEDHQKWLEDKLQGIAIMKAAHAKDISEITEQQYADIARIQKQFEKSLNNYTGEIGVDKVQIEKSRFDALEKAEAELVTKAAELNTAQAALTAAQEEIKTMQAEVAEIKKAAEIAEVKQDLAEIVKAEDLDTKAEKMLLVKAASPEAYQEMLATMKQAKELIEKSALFEEQGNPDEASQEEIQKAARRKAIAGE